MKCFDYTRGGNFIYLGTNRATQVQSTEISVFAHFLLVSAGRLLSVSTFLMWTELWNEIRPIMPGTFRKL